MNIFRRFFHKIKVKEPDTLDIIEVGDYGAYNTTRCKYTTLSSLKTRAISGYNITGGLTSTTYNEISYPVYDLDSITGLDTFKREVKDNYVLFQSSSEHYWAILDLPLTNIRDYCDNINWVAICDRQYKHMCVNINTCRLRFTYENIDRKPFIIKDYGDDYSENFKNFIDKFVELIEEDGLELSVLRWKNSNLLNIFNTKTNRRNKLNEIIN